MKKEELNSRLLIVNQNYKIGLLTREFIQNGKWTFDKVKWLESMRANDRIQYSVDELHQALQKCEMRTEIMNAFEMSLRRTFMRELHENVLFYCKKPISLRNIKPFLGFNLPGLQGMSYHIKKEESLMSGLMN